MGANTSRQKAAGYVRMQLVSSYAVWDILVRCERCERETRMALRQIAERHPDATISDVMGRLRCSGCGGQPSRVQVEKGRQTIVIAGPGSY